MLIYTFPLYNFNSFFEHNLRDFFIWSLHLTNLKKKKTIVSHCACKAVKHSYFLSLGHLSLLLTSVTAVSVVRWLVPQVICPSAPQAKQLRSHNSDASVSSSRANGLVGGDESGRKSTGWRDLGEGDILAGSNSF